MPQRSALADRVSTKTGEVQLACGRLPPSLALRPEVAPDRRALRPRSEEHTSELQSLQ